MMTFEGYDEVGRLLFSSRLFQGCLTADCLYVVSVPHESAYFPLCFRDIRGTLLRCWARWPNFYMNLIFVGCVVNWLVERFKVWAVQLDYS